MKFLTCLFLLVATSCFGAVPAYTSFRGTGGITVSSNPPVGFITIDGSAITGPTNGVTATTATNISVYVVNNYFSNITSFPVGTNTIYFTNECITKTRENTNILIVTGAGTAGASGTYNWSGTQFTNGIDFIYYSAGDVAWVLSNSGSGLLYAVNDGVMVGQSKTWDATINGANPPPTYTYGPSTNCTTVLASTATFNIPVVGTNLFVSASVGDDTKAARGRIDRKWRTFAGAVAASHDGDTINLDPGDYPFAGPIQLTNRVKVFGAGRGITRLGTQGGVEERLYLGDASVIASLTLYGALTLGNQAPGTGVGVTNGIVFDCDIFGDSDAIEMDRFDNFTVINSTLTSAYDGLADWDNRLGGSNRVARLYDTFIRITNNVTFTTLHGISGGESRIEMFGGGIEVLNGSANNNCVYLADDGFRTTHQGSVLLSGVRLRSFSTNNAAPFVNNVNRLPVFLDNCTMERISPTLVGGSYTNQWSDRYVTIPNGATRTNRLVDIRSLTNANVSASPQGFEVAIYDAGGTASGTNVLIATQGGQTINGGPTITNIATDNGMLLLVSDGANWKIKAAASGGGGGNVSSNSLGGITSIGPSTNRSDTRFLDNIYVNNGIFDALFLGGKILVSDGSGQILESAFDTGQIGGGSLKTNASQFAANTTLNIKDGAALTNTHNNGMYVYNKFTNAGAAYFGEADHSEIYLFENSGPAYHLFIDTVDPSLIGFGWPAIDLVISNNNWRAMTSAGLTNFEVTASNIRLFPSGSLGRTLTVGQPNAAGRYLSYSNGMLMVGNVSNPNGTFQHNSGTGSGATALKGSLEVDGANGGYAAAVSGLQLDPSLNTLNIESRIDFKATNAVGHMVFTVPGDLPGVITNRFTGTNGSAGQVLTIVSSNNNVLSLAWSNVTAGAGSGNFSTNTDGSADFTGGPGAESKIVLFGTNGVGVMAFTLPGNFPDVITNRLNFSNAAPGQVLTVVSSNNHVITWGISNAPTGGATTLNGLTDVDTVTSPQIWDYLGWNGSIWTNLTPFFSYQVYVNTTNIFVGSNAVDNLFISTNGSFKLVSTGTPLINELENVSVSNYGLSTIYVTNTFYDTTVGSNVTVWAVPALSIRKVTFQNVTNHNLGVARWELKEDLQKGAELSVAGNGLSILTNTANSIVTISNNVSAYTVLGGGGGDYTLTATMALVSVGNLTSTNTAGTYRITASFLYNNSVVNATDLVGFQLRNVTDSVYISSIVFYKDTSIGSDIGVVPIVVDAVVTLSGTKVIELWGYNASSARGAVDGTSGRSSFTVQRLY